MQSRKNRSRRSRKIRKKSKSHRTKRKPRRRKAKLRARRRAVRVRLRAKSKLATFRVRNKGLVRVFQSEELRDRGLAYGRFIAEVKSTKGRSPSLNPRGISQALSAITKARREVSRLKPGAYENEQVSIKIRYRGYDGKFKTRWENFVTNRPEEVATIFLKQLEKGIKYTNHATGEKFSATRGETGPGTIKKITYEQLSLVKATRKAKPKF